MRPLLWPSLCRQTRSVRFNSHLAHRRATPKRTSFGPARARRSFVAPLGRVDVLEGQGLLVQDRPLAVLPGGHVGEALIVPQRLAFGGLVLLPEVTATRLLPVEGVDAHQP